MKLRELLDKNRRGEKLALLFPGQGSQVLGMGKDFYTDFHIARVVFEEASDVLGFNVKKLCFDGPFEDLTLTENLQPSLVTVEIAIWRCLKHEFAPNISFYAGHSLGEYSALVAAESLSLADALRLTNLRGKAMQQAVPPGDGAMAALLGLDLAQEKLVEQLCATISQNEKELLVSVANYNAPGQIVVAGRANGIKQLLAEIKLIPEISRTKSIMLPVSAPFHCELMEPAKKALENPVAEVAFFAPNAPVLQNVTAKPTNRVSELSMGLLKQITAPVLWRQTLECLKNEKVSFALEVGPGQVLSGLLKRSAPEISCVSVNSMKVFCQDGRSEN